MNSFPVELSSKRAGSNDLPQSFTAKLPKTYNFSGAAWGVGLKSISIPYAWLNVPESQQFTLYMFDASQELGFRKVFFPQQKPLMLPPGSYTTSELAAAMNEVFIGIVAVTEVVGVPEVRLGPPANSQLYIVLRKTHGHFVYVNLPPLLCEIFGVQKEYFYRAAKTHYKKVKDFLLNNPDKEFFDEEVFHKSLQWGDEKNLPTDNVKRVTNVYVSTPSIRVYCNIIGPHVDTNSYANSLGKLEIESFSGKSFAIDRFRGYWENPYCYPLNRDIVYSIEINLITSMYEHLPLLGGEVEMTLIFKKLEQIEPPIQIDLDELAMMAADEPAPPLPVNSSALRRIIADPAQAYESERPDNANENEEIIFNHFASADSGVVVDFNSEQLEGAIEALNLSDRSQRDNKEEVLVSQSREIYNILIETKNKRKKDGSTSDSAVDTQTIRLTEQNLENIIGLLECDESVNQDDE